jgi:hypothetical protein
MPLLTELEELNERLSIKISLLTELADATTLSPFLGDSDAIECRQEAGFY